MFKKTVKVRHKVGLHARPAAIFVKTAMSYPCQVVMRNTTINSKPANAKSILGVLSLGVNQDHVIEIETDGEQAEAALSALVELVENNFGEK